MEYKRATYGSSESEAAHKKAQDAIDHATEVRKERLSHLGDKTPRSPHLVSAGVTLKRCSVCGHPFSPDEPDMDRAFADHIRKAHQPGQTTEDSSQAALRVVREATENK